MSELARAPKRAKGGPLLSALLPGLPQLLAGRWGTGWMALIVWAGSLWIVATRFGRMGSLAAGAWDERLAVATIRILELLVFELGTGRHLQRIDHGDGSVVGLGWPEGAAASRYTGSGTSGRWNHHVVDTIGGG